MKKGAVRRYPHQYPPGYPPKLSTGGDKSGCRARVEADSLHQEPVLPEKSLPCVDAQIDNLRRGRDELSVGPMDCR